MRLTVYLDDEPGGMAVEIRYEVAHRGLLSEVQTSKLSPLEGIP